MCVGWLQCLLSRSRCYGGSGPGWVPTLRWGRCAQDITRFFIPGDPPAWPGSRSPASVIPGWLSQLALPRPTSWVGECACPCVLVLSLRKLCFPRRLTQLSAVVEISAGHKLYRSIAKGHTSRLASGFQAEPGVCARPVPRQARCVPSDKANRIRRLGTVCKARSDLVFTGMPNPSCIRFLRTGTQKT